MNTESREHISCLMDGEISRETGRFLVRRLGADEELCATWARYHLVRDCLRHQEGGLASENLAARIRQAIERESLPARPRKARRPWIRPAVGMAIAASVALMAVVAVGPDSQPVSPAGGDLAGRVEAPSFTSPQGLVPAPASEQASLLGESAGDSRMNAYLLRHYQAAGTTGGKGFVTFVPIVIRPASVRDESPEPAEGVVSGPGEEAPARLQ
jgi:sigma-E factor negative regulatory protein RseA